MFSRHQHHPLLWLPGVVLLALAVGVVAPVGSVAASEEALPTFGEEAFGEAAFGEAAFGEEGFGDEEFFEAEVDLSEAGDEAPVAGPAGCGSDTELLYRPGVGFDCRFARSEAGKADEDPFVELVTDNGESEQFWPCEVTDEEILCRFVEQEDISRGVYFFDDGETNLTLWYNSRRYSNAGSFATTNPGLAETALVRPRNFHQAVLFGQPLTAFAYGTRNADQLFVRIRERNSTEVIASLAIGAPSAADPTDLALEIDLPLGNYRMWGCMGQTDQDCTELVGGDPFQIIDGTLTELIEGHNRPSADRINIVFSQTGLPQPGDAEPGPNPADEPSLDLDVIARSVLGIDGPTENFGTLAYGPFSIEPLASRLHLFNFWLLPAELNTNRSLIGDLETDPEALVGFDLPNPSVVTFYNQGDPRSDARLPQFAQGFQEPTAAVPELPVEPIAFGGTRIWINTFGYADAGQVLAHEWGHALFGLRDEYDEDQNLGEVPDDVPSEFVSGALVGYPNCAPTQEIAEAWWGDQLGEVDPFIDEVLDDYEDAGLQVPEFITVDALRTEITRGGCFGDASVDPNVFRPGANSIMNDVTLPVFGSVNRIRVEQILGRYTGRGVAGSASDVGLRSERTAEATDCAGTLLSHLDPPEGPIRVNELDCEVDATTDPVAVTCPSLAGDVQAVSLSLADQEVPVELPPEVGPFVETTSTPTDLSDDSTESDTDGSEGDDAAAEESASPAFWVGLGVLALAGVLLFGMIRLRRDQRDA